MSKCIKLNVLDVDTEFDAYTANNLFRDSGGFFWHIDVGMYVVGV